MSVTVRIEYRQPDPELGGIEKPLACREYRIERINDANRAANPGDERDQVYEYKAAIMKGRDTGLEATFQHRYGDDLGILAGKATDAIRAALGSVGRHL